MDRLPLERGARHIDGTIRRRERRQHIQPNLRDEHRSAHLAHPGRFLSLLPPDLVGMQALGMVSIGRVINLAQSQNSGAVVMLSRLSVIVVRMKYGQPVRRHKRHSEHQD